MTPITDRSQARKSGYAQVRAALQRFEGDVVSAEVGEYPPRTDEEGNPIAAREYLDIECVNVEVLETTEELAMPISEWNFRVNCSEWEGTFWIEDFLASTDKFKLLVPDALVGKRIVWKKVTREGSIPLYNTTNFIVEAVKRIATEPTGNPAPAPAPVEVEGGAVDLVEEARKLAIGKTEDQFKMSITLEGKFAGSPVLALAKTGALMQSFLDGGKLVLVEGKFQEPG